MSDVQHYLVLGGEVLEEVQYLLKSQREAEEAYQEALKGFSGIKGLYATRTGFKGILFEDGLRPDTAVWKPSEEFHGIWRPVDSALVGRLERIQRPDNWDLTDYLTGHELHFEHLNQCWAIVLEVHGSDFVIGVPVHPDRPDWWMPYEEDARPLSRSEYLALVEGAKGAAEQGSVIHGGAQ